MTLSERTLREKAKRVLAGTQSGGYTKHAMAYDILALLDRIARLRGGEDVGSGDVPEEPR